MILIKPLYCHSHSSSCPEGTLAVYTRYVGDLLADGSMNTSFIWTYCEACMRLIIKGRMTPLVEEDFERI